ncbi:MAG: lactate racemase domain-containing protein [Candidatus Helarchaeota archaeon]
MAQIFKVPWGAWYEDRDLQLEFPESWNIQKFPMNGADKVQSLDDIKNAIDNPIGSPSIQQIAKGKNNAVIVIEDISRPTCVTSIIDIVLNQLNMAGISNNDITIIFATGAHRPMNRIDFIKKVGIKIVETINIENHHPYENLIYLGESNQGTPIYLNKTYYKADIKIAVGSVIPHPLAGFGGGAKIILPGICGIETLSANHQAGVRGIGIGLGFITKLRLDIEDVCKKVGLDFSINIINNMKRGIAGVFAGNFIEAHRKAIEYAKKIYYTKIPSKIKFDIGFFNLYPEDTELSQATKGLNIFLSTKRLLNRKGAIILLTAATEGRGFHSLLAETGSKLYKNWDETILGTILKKFTFGVFSPNINKLDVLHFYSDNTIFHTKFHDMINDLEKIYGQSPNACIFPTSIQIPSE